MIIEMIFEKRFWHAFLLQVKASVVWEYIKSCTLTVGLLTLLFHIGYNACAVGTNIWLAKWSTDEDEESENMSLSTSVQLLIDIAIIFIGIYNCGWICKTEIPI